MDWSGTALFSQDERYRYSLTRTWDEYNPKRCLFVCLNPSTATSTVNDPTIRRCMGFAAKWGYGSYYLGNLFGYRATNPKDMKAQEDPMGPDNLVNILDMAYDMRTYGGKIICAWGTHGSYRNQDKLVLNVLKNSGFKVHAIHLTKDGYPAHPLYLSGKLEPVEWSPLN